MYIVFLVENNKEVIMKEQRPISNLIQIYGSCSVVCCPSNPATGGNGTMAVSTLNLMKILELFELFQFILKDE